MDSLWPWLAAAGLGALHGLNPASGWVFAAACGVRSRDHGHAWRALGPIASGHVASLAVVAGAVALGGSIDRRLMQALAASLLLALLIVTGVRRLLGHTIRAAGRPAGQAGLALWSFIVATGHGAGAMLVPALMPLCAGPASTTAAGSLALALAAVGIHLAAMLGASGMAAALACRVMRDGR
jgi:hypothetical protein